MIAERLNLQQADAVAAYLTREVLAGQPKKLVRVGTDAVIGVDGFYHEELARRANLHLLEVPEKWGDTVPEGCNDGAKLLYLQEFNR